MNLSFILQLAAATAAAGMALAMFFWSEKSPARWLFAVGMGTLALESAFGALCTDAVHPESVAYWQQWRLLTRALLPSVWLAFSLTYSRGNYRDFLHRWRWVLAISLLLPVGLSAGFHREMIAGIHQIPPAQEWFVQLGWPGLAQSAVNLLAAVLTLMNLERTYRAAVGTMRWRIKYVILGVGLLFAGRIYSSSQVLLFSGVNPTFGAVNATALLAACLLILRSLLRKGVFSVDIYPSHTFLSASVVIVLAGVYLMAVGLLAKLSTVFGGDTAFPLKAFLVFAALVGLAMLVMSDRLRDFAQRFVSRHLSRPRYDYRKVWQTFTQKTTSRLTSEDLCRAVAEWLSETFNVLSVTIWLVDESGRRLRFGASTSLTPPGANRLAPSPADLRGAINALKNNPLPVDIDATSADWARPLRQINPHHFQAGGSRVCVPVAAGGELLGVVTLGDRVGGLAFSLEDFELLKCIGDQVGSNLLSLRLSDKLAQGKELEAFQTMSAFFVHDLKNTAHTLALMLQNLPKHFDNPEFREDALRAIGKAAQRLNELISRLGLLRKQPALRTLPVNLSDVIQTALKTVPPTGGVAIVTDLPPLPPVPLDAEQIQKVATNLVLNALDACGETGEIRVTTAAQDGWVSLTVQDTGCGMSPEFINRSLFRPFQTTKKKGIGIGMYHCKAIVDAHHGRIEVESEEGKGTTFRVLLPAQ